MRPVGGGALGGPPSGVTSGGEETVGGVSAPTTQDTDEFVELYNNTDSAIIVSTTDGSAGWALAASDGVTRFTVPNGTVIPARGHYLGVNSLGYSLASYPGAFNETATGDATYTTDIPDGSGIALFRTANPSNFTLAERLDAAGYAGVGALYREGAGFPTGGAEIGGNLDYSFIRSMTRASGGVPKDTGDNAADFIGINTNGSATGQGQNLGAPGPENLHSPFLGNSLFAAALLDPAVSSSSPPNRARDLTSDPANNSDFGTLSIRRTFTNNSGLEITKLRFRIVEITTFTSPPVAGQADLRVRNSGDATVSTSGGTVTVHGTTVEVPPAQPSGGGWNTSVNVGFISTNPLFDGNSVSVQFLLGVKKTGNFKFFINIEAINNSGQGLDAPQR